MKNTKTFISLGFDSEETKDIVESLNVLLSNLQIHYQKLRTYHWNVTGPDFFDLHQFFEAEYNKVKLQIDEIAERIKVFGKSPKSLLSEYLEISEIKETDSNISSDQMVKEIISDYEILFSFMIEAVEMASDLGDISSRDLVAGFLKSTEKSHWMLTSFSK